MILLDIGVGFGGPETQILRRSRGEWRGFHEIVLYHNAFEKQVQKSKLVGILAVSNECKSKIIGQNVSTHMYILLLDSNGNTSYWYWNGNRAYYYYEVACLLVFLPILFPVGYY